MILLLASIAIAAEPVPGECEDIIGLSAGQAIPGELLHDDGTMRCHAVLLPLSEALELRSRSEQLEAQLKKYDADVAALIENRDFYRDGYYRLLQAQEQPVPWLKSNSAARWGGRLEALVAFTAVAIVTREVTSYDPITN